MNIHEGAIGRERPFTLGESKVLPPDLIVWQDIRRAYAEFPTTESLERVSALHTVAADLKKEGLVADLLIGGSLAFYQSNRESDIDLVGIVTPEKWLDVRNVMREYGDRLSQRLGYRVYLPDDHEYFTNVFNPQDLTTYLDKTYFAPLTHPAWVKKMEEEVNLLYFFHNADLAIGTYRLDILKKIDDLKTKTPTGKNEEKPRHELSPFGSFLDLSFNRYQKRLSQHPRFSSLPKLEQTAYMDYLEERQHQFLFYVENPQFCR